MALLDFTIDVKAKLKNAKELKSELESLSKDKNIDIKISSKGLDNIQKDIKTLEKNKFKIEADVKSAQSKVTKLTDDITKKLNRIEKEKLKIRVNDAEVIKIDKDIKSLNGTIELIEKRKLKMKVNSTEWTNANTDIEKARVKIDKLNTKKTKLQLSTKEAKDNIQILHNDINRLKDQRTKVQVDTMDAKNKLAEIDAEITKLTRAEHLVNIKLNQEQFNNSMKQIKTGIKEFGSDWMASSKIASDAINGIGTKISGLGTTILKTGTLATAVFGAGLTKGLKDSIMAFSDTEEAIYKFHDVIGDKEASDAFQATLLEANKVLGYSQLQLHDNASHFYSLAKAQGIASDKAEEMALGFAQMTRDASAFYNVSEEQLRPAMESIFTGQTVSIMKQFGLSMHVATMQEQLLAETTILLGDGLASTAEEAEDMFFLMDSGFANSREEASKMWKSMSVGEKAMARYAVLQEQFKRLGVTGNWKDTMYFSLPTQLELAKSGLQDLMAKFGEAPKEELLNLMIKINEIIQDLVSKDPAFFKNLYDNLKNFLSLGAMVMAFGGALKVLGGGISLMSKPLGGTIGLFKTLKKGTMDAEGNLTGLGKVVGGVKGAFSALNPKVIASNGGIASMVSSISIGNIALGVFTTGLQGIVTTAVGMIGVMGLVTGAVAGMVVTFGLISDPIARMSAMTTAFEGIETVISRASTAIGDFGDKLKAINVEEVMNQLSEAFTGSGITESLGQLATNIGTVFSQIGRIMWEAFEAIDWNAIARSMAKGLNKALDGLWNLDWSKIGKVLETAFSTAITFLGTIDWTGAFLGLIRTIGNLTTTIVTAFFNMGTDAMKQLVSGLKSVKVSDLESIGTNIFDTIKTGFVNVGKIKDSVVEFINSLTTGFTEAFPELKRIATELWDKFKEKAEEVDWMQVGYTLMYKIMSGIGDVGIALWGLAVTIFNTMLENIKEIDWEKLGRDIINFIWMGVQFMIGLFVGFVVAQFMNLLRFVSEIDWFTLGVNIINFIWDGLKSIWTSISTWWDTQWTDINTKAKAIDWGQLGIDIITTLAEGFASLGSLIWEAVQGGLETAWTNIKSFWSNKPPIDVNVSTRTSGGGGDSGGGSGGGTRLAYGGVTSRRVDNATIGEAGVQEAIIPLKSNILGQIGQSIFQATNRKFSNGDVNNNNNSSRSVTVGQVVVNTSASTMSGTSEDMARELGKLLGGLV